MKNFPFLRYGDQNMRKIEMNTVMIGDEEYPIYCDLYVLDRIQSRMSVNDFERGIVGVDIVRDRNGDPMHDENGNIRLKPGKHNIATMLFGLTLMINEGLEIRSEQDHVECEVVTEKDIARRCTMQIAEIAVILHDEFFRCIGIKKKEETKTKVKPGTTSRKKSTQTSTSTKST